jgi:hypothetical protein
MPSIPQFAKERFFFTLNAHRNVKTDVSLRKNKKSEKAAHLGGLQGRFFVRLNFQKRVHHGEGARESDESSSSSSSIIVDPAARLKMGARLWGNLMG